MLNNIEELAYLYHNPCVNVWHIQIIKYNGSDVDGIFDYGIFEINNAETHKCICAVRLIIDRLLKMSTGKAVRTEKATNLLIYNIYDIWDDIIIRVLMSNLNMSPIFEIAIKDILKEW